jgi:glycosyltransferase involved in cell wall biosynthesis
MQPCGGGVDAYVAALASDQARRGWRVAIACHGGSRAAAAAGVDVHHWSATRDPGAATAREITQLRTILRRTRPDLVHLHSSKAGLTGRLALRGRLPTVFQPHAWSWHAVDGIARRLAIAWERRAARWCDLILCVSEGERAAATAAGIVATFRVVHNGVDTRALVAASPPAARAARAELGLPADSPVVVCVGRLTRQKGQDLLLDAWPHVSDDVPDARLVLVGAGPDEDELRQQAPDGVTFAGEQEQVTRWLTAADVVAVPSRWDGMSLALLEALAAGRSVVATDVPGAAEAVGSSAGAVVPPQPRPLAEAIVERLRNPERACAEGRAARLRVERRYDLVRTFDGVADAYADVLARRGRATGERWARARRPVVV